MRKGFADWLKKANPDIICIQETKAQPEQIPVEEFKTLGYETFVFSAEKKGYSGVAILSREIPHHIEYGMGIKKYDDEGRMIRADFDQFSVISVYHPSGSSGDVRQAFKMQWLSDFQAYIAGLKNKTPNLIVSGDYNICHQPIDIHDPIRNATSSGFLPEERAWMTQFLASGFVDTFRYVNPEPHHYSWWSYRANARAKNLGWRIDYHMITDKLEPFIHRALILPDVMHSDHCPVLLEINL